MGNIIIITGGAGFIGSHLCRRLIAEGEKVVCIDRRDTEKIKDLKQHQNFGFIQHDINKQFINWLGIKKIFHLACPASPIDHQRDPTDILHANTFGIYNTIQLARTNQAEVVFTSSSEVYGDPKEKPQHESYWGNVNPLGKQAAYKEGKRGAETMLKTFSQTEGFLLKIARVFNTYGPDMDQDGRVIYEFIYRALKGQPLLVHSDGQQTRSFCYIDDLIEGLIKLSKSTRANGKAYNLGNPKEIKILDLAHRIIKLTGSSSSIEFVGGYPENARGRQPDISNAHTTFGFNPDTNLNEGIVETINHCKKVIQCQEEGRPS